MGRWNLCLGFFFLSFTLASLPLPIPKIQVTAASGSGSDSDSFSLEDDIRLLPILNSPDGEWLQFPHHSEEESSSSSFSLDDDIPLFMDMPAMPEMTPSTAAMNELFDHRSRFFEITEEVELINGTDLQSCIFRLDGLTSAFQELKCMDFSREAGLPRAIQAGNHLCNHALRGRTPLNTLVAKNTEFLRHAKDIIEFQKALKTFAIIETCLETSIKKIIRDAVVLETQMQISMGSIRRARVQYDAGLAQAAKVIWDALKDGFGMHEAAAVLLEMELEFRFTEIIEAAQPIKPAVRLQLSNDLSSYCHHYEMCERIRILASNMVEVVPILGPLFCISKLEDCTERFHVYMSTVDSTCKPSLETTVDSVAAQVPEAELNALDIHHPDFDARQYRLHHLHYRHLRGVNRPTLKSDPIYATHFSKIYDGKKGSLADSSSDSFEDFMNETSPSHNLDMDELVRELASLDPEENLIGPPQLVLPSHSPSSSSSDDQTITLRPGTVDGLRKQAATFLFVNPDSCAHNQHRYIRPVFEGLPTLISPTPNLLERQELRERHITQSTVANLKGLVEIRDAVIDQFVTAIRMKQTGLVIGRFGCPACGITARQLAPIYREAMQIFAGHGLRELFICDDELWIEIQRILVVENNT